MPDDAALWNAWLAAQGVTPAAPPRAPVPPGGRRPRLLVARRDARGALAAWAGAWREGWDVFLADPAWGAETRAGFCRRCGADAVSADDPGWTAGPGAEKCFGNEPIVAIPTGGSSGVPKPAVHTAATLAASARAGASHFGGGAHHAVSLLPAHHVSGLMPSWRAAVTGGAVLWADWKAWLARPEVPAGATLSLVPTQLVRLRETPGAAEALRRASAILLGGAAADPALLTWARSERLPLAPCYGMTETAAFVAACRPAEFLAGADDLGTAVPGASLSTDAEGRLQVSSPGMFLGYWPEARQPGLWPTSDAAKLSPEGRLTVLGRLDDLILCGGEKASPGRIEAFLRSTGLVRDVAVFGRPDPVWGARVAAAVVLAEDVDLKRLGELAEKGLPPWERPKEWLALGEIPRTAAGKVDRGALRGS